MLFSKVDRWALASVVVALHAWVFFQHPASEKARLDRPQRLIEVWNVPPALLAPPVSTGKTTSQPESLSRRSGGDLRRAATPATPPIERTVETMRAAPDRPDPGVASVSTREATAAASEPADPFDVNLPRSERGSERAPVDIGRLRALAREDEKNRVKTPLEKLQERERSVRTIETTVADAAARGARKDCQTAYGGAGVFAIVPLLYGTLTDDGCKWK